MSNAKWYCIVQRARYFHWRAKRRIRRKIARGRQIKVLFIDSEVAKWKTQTLFELMQRDGHYEPIVGVSIRDHSEAQTSSEINSEINQAKSFFLKKGDAVVTIYNCDAKQPIDLAELAPDIVFYQQPWYDIGCHSIIQIHKRALTCYVPYFVPNIGFPEIEAHMRFHRFLSFFFLLNDAWIREYSHGVSQSFYSGELVDVGHPMLDYFISKDNKPKPTSTKTIIYAPHHSVRADSFMKIGTFLENGLAILQYAKAHREFNWVFKPHPVLKHTLYNLNGWGKARADKYYAEWAEIGNVCENGDYVGLFAKASALITDCGSFLVEFAATGKPIIHLLSSITTATPAPPMRELLSTYYSAKSLDELWELFKIILEKGEDPLGEKRILALKMANLLRQNAAKNIMDFFAKEFAISS